MKKTEIMYRSLRYVEAEAIMSPRQTYTYTIPKGSLVRIQNQDEENTYFVVVSTDHLYHIKTELFNKNFDKRVVRQWT